MARKLALPLALSLALLAAACGDDGDDTTTDEPDTGEETASCDVASPSLRMGRQATARS